MLEAMELKFDVFAEKTTKQIDKLIATQKDLTGKIEARLKAPEQNRQLK